MRLVSSGWHQSKGTGGGLRGSLLRLGGSLGHYAIPSPTLCDCANIGQTPGGGDIGLAFLCFTHFRVELLYIYSVV